MSTTTNMFSSVVGRKGIQLPEQSVVLLANLYSDGILLSVLDNSDGASILISTQDFWFDTCDYMTKQPSMGN